jgi:hypothetical protein
VTTVVRFAARKITTRSEKIFHPSVTVLFIWLDMRPHQNAPFDASHRFFYGAVVGAILGTIIGTMPGNEPVLGLIGFAIGAVALGGLAALSKSFWESLLAAWELVRMAFWRW